MKRLWPLVIGLALAAAVLALAPIDLHVVADHFRTLGVLGVSCLLLVYWTGRLAGILSWFLVIPSIAATPIWFARVCRIHLIGVAVERLTPLAGLGGEPVKAGLLKRDYGLRLRDVAASLVVTRMTDLFAVLGFCTIGLASLWVNESGDSSVRVPALATLAIFALSALGFFAVQKLRLLSRTARLLSRRWPARLQTQPSEALRQLGEIEDLILSYYGANRGRFLLSVLSTFGEWCAEGAIVWLTFYFLGSQVGIADAAGIAAFALLVRSALFFVPADLGTQEGALVAVGKLVAGDPAAGLVIASILRGGDILVALVGLALGAGSLRELGRGSEQALGSGGDPDQRDVANRVCAAAGDHRRNEP